MILSGSTTYDQSSRLISSINKILNETWSRKQIAFGKKIEIPIEWGYDVYSITASRYRKEGWSVKKSVELTSQQRHYFLEFRNPHWKTYDDQFHQKQ